MLMLFCPKFYCCVYDYWLLYIWSFTLNMIKMCAELNYIRKTYDHYKVNEWIVAVCYRLIKQGFTPYRQYFSLITAALDIKCIHQVKRLTTINSATWTVVREKILLKWKYKPFVSLTIPMIKTTEVNLF